MKTETVKLKGRVVKVLPNAMFKVQLEKIENEILCYLCGKMNKKFIKPVLGDDVMVEMSPTDITKGRICQRM